MVVVVVPTCREVTYAPTVMVVVAGKALGGKTKTHGGSQWAVGSDQILFSPC